jgi:hypothetical protein
MKEYYYICNKCIDNVEVECYTIGIIAERACDICRKSISPENLSCVSAKDSLKILLRYMSKEDIK